MPTYLEKIELWLREIDESLCEFISTIKIKQFHNDPSSGIVVITHPYYYDTHISDIQRKQQMDLKKKYSEWEEHFLLLTKNIPSDTAKKIYNSLKYIKNQIELDSGWDTTNIATQNIENIKKNFNNIYRVIELFKSNRSVVFIPDTNSLIKAPDFENYKKLSDNNITILLIPTVLSELDKLKIIHRDENFRKKVDSVINRIKGYRTQGSLQNGIIVYKTITVKMIANEPNFKNTLSWLDKDNNDDRIIAGIIEYQVSNPSHEVYLITSDINLQNKAEMARLPFFETPDN